MSTIEVREVSVYYPEYWHLDGTLDRRDSDREVTLTITGTRWDLHYHLGLGDAEIHRFNGWGQVIDWEVHPDEQPCRLKGKTVLDQLVSMRLVDRPAEKAIHEAMNPEPCNCMCRGQQET